MSDALADTSIFLASEQIRDIHAYPDGEVRISVVTITELLVGVLRAPDDATRAARQTTLEVARRFIPIPYDEAVAERLARIIGALREAGRRVNLFDAVIAATAAAHGLVVWTQDADFEVIERHGGGPPVLRA